MAKNIREQLDRLIDRGILCLEMAEEAGSPMRFYKLQNFLTLQTDVLKSSHPLKGPSMIASVALICWHSTDKGKFEDLKIDSMSIIDLDKVYASTKIISTPKKGKKK